MKHHKKSLNWMPFFSICSLIILLSTVGWLMGAETKPLVTGLGVMGAVTTIANFFPPGFNFRHYWYTTVTTEAHIMLVVFAFICSVFLLLFVVPKYEFNLSIKKKE